MNRPYISDRFRCERMLGRGGMSEVWLAEDLELGRKVAVKLLAPTADRLRFEREARMAASLAHPNIATIFDFGESPDGRPFLVLEYVPGGTLRDELDADGPLLESRTRQVAEDIAGGLACAHSHGIVHRDLKPDNVLFDEEGRAKLLDFGIARATGFSTLTEPGTIIGSAAYLSPEQAAGEPVTPASDVYAFGVILFRILTGRLPFDDGTMVELALKHRREPAPGVLDVRPYAPRDLAALTDRALEKDPDDRPVDGSALLAALLGEAPPTSRDATLVLAPRADGMPTVELARRRRSIGRRAALAAVALGLVVTGLVGAAVLTGGSTPTAPAGTVRAPGATASTQGAGGRSRERTRPATSSDADAKTASTAVADESSTTSRRTTTRPVTTAGTTTTGSATSSSSTTSSTTTEPTTTATTTTPSSP